MTGGTGRDTRRRRVLSEGARSSQSNASNDSATQRSAGERPRRFAPGEDSVSFAVARGLLPTRAWPMVGVVVGGILLAALLGVGHCYQALVPAEFAALLDMSSIASLGHWVTSTLMLLSALLAFNIYGLRTNRTDDVRGRYHWWMLAAFAGVVANAAFVTQFHVVVDRSLAAATGLSPFTGFWWLLPAGLVTGVLVVRPIADLKESALAFTFTIAAGVLLAASVVASSGALGGSALAGHAVLVAASSLLVALVSLVSAQLFYVRRVLLETDGVIAAPQPKPAKPRKEKAKEEPAATPEPQPTIKMSEPPAEEPQEKPQQKARKQRQQPAAASTQWTDGTDGGDAGYDDDAPKRKLTKAERKRLRKQKAGRYAA